LAGVVVCGVIATRMPHYIGYALMSAGGLALSVPFAVATASPLIGRLFTQWGVGRIPEETEPPAALAALRLPAMEAGAVEILQRS
jgi:membrane glycosyltransferase